MWARSKTSTVVVVQVVMGMALLFCVLLLVVGRTGLGRGYAGLHSNDDEIISEVQQALAMQEAMLAHIEALQRSMSDLRSFHGLQGAPGLL